MQLPFDSPVDLQKYDQYDSDEKLFAALLNNEDDLKSFFFAACKDEFWCYSHSQLIKEVLGWLTESYVQGIYPRHYFYSWIEPMRKSMHALRSYFPLDLTLKTSDAEILLNSFLLCNQNDYFERRLINECRNSEIRTLLIGELPFSILQLIEEYTFYGQIKNLWNLQHEQLWEIIKYCRPLDLQPILETCQNSLRRYIDSDNVYELLLHAHEQKLQILQNHCCEFINSIKLGVYLPLMDVEFLGLEFLDFKTNALEIFEILRAHLTHLFFTGDLTTGFYFVQLVDQCPRLKCLDLNHTIIQPEQLNSIPEHVKEIHLSGCKWISNQALDILAKVCPNLNKLDMSGNDPLNYAIWGELLKFSKLTSLNVSRCFQTGDAEFRMILQGCPKLVELSIDSCQQISPDGFFEIGKLSPHFVILNISRNTISDAALIDVMTKSRDLISIDLERCTNLSERGILEAVRNSANLKKINLTGIGLSEDGLKQIQAVKPYLKIVY